MCKPAQFTFNARSITARNPPTAKRLYVIRNIRKYPNNRVIPSSKHRVNDLKMKCIKNYAE